VVGARPPRHRDPARRDHRGHPVRLGAPEARRASAVADREGDCAGAERADPVAVASLKARRQYQLRGSSSRLSRSTVRRRFEERFTARRMAHEYRSGDRSTSRCNSSATMSGKGCCHW
jgi:hypothetical protein